MSLVTALRRRELQPLWSSLHRLSLIGMNYWSSELPVTGERDALRWLVRHLRDVHRPIVFDVGANVGDYSAAVLDAFGRRCTIHAFEPSTTAFDVASKQLSKESAVKLNRIALSDREGEALLMSSEPGASIASLERLESPKRPFDSSAGEIVPTSSIDAYCAREGIAEIHFLKLDVEGHELAVLNGARRMLTEQRIRFVQFEFGENNVSARTFLADFVRLLAGFEFYRVVPGGPVRWTYAGGRSEIFATMNYLAEAPRRVP
jgi:FkbM family methyltransferase